MKKKDLLIVEYFQQTISLADTLVVVGQRLQDCKIIYYILAGLSFEFDLLVTVITTRVDPMSPNHLSGHLLSFKLRLEQHHGSP